MSFLKFVLLWQWEDVPSGRQVFIYNFFLSLEANLLQTFNFLFYRILKNITKFCVVVLGLRPMTVGVITFRKINETFWLMKGMC